MVENQTVELLCANLPYFASALRGLWNPPLDLSCVCLWLMKTGPYQVKGMNKVWQRKLQQQKWNVKLVKFLHGSKSCIIKANEFVYLGWGWAILFFQKFEILDIFCWFQNPIVIYLESSHSTELSLGSISNRFSSRLLTFHSGIWIKPETYSRTDKGSHIIFKIPKYSLKGLKSESKF